MTIKKEKRKYNFNIFRNEFRFPKPPGPQVSDMTIDQVIVLHLSFCLAAGPLSISIYWKDLLSSPTGKYWCAPTLYVSGYPFFCATLHVSFNYIWLHTFKLTICVISSLTRTKYK